MLRDMYIMTLMLRSVRSAESCGMRVPSMINSTLRARRLLLLGHAQTVGIGELVLRT